MNIVGAYMALPSIVIYCIQHDKSVFQFTTGDYVFHLPHPHIVDTIATHQKPSNICSFVWKSYIETGLFLGSFPFAVSFIEIIFVITTSS